MLDSDAKKGKRERDRERKEREERGFKPAAINVEQLKRTLGKFLVESCRKTSSDPEVAAEESTEQVEKGPLSWKESEGKYQGCWTL